MGRLGTLEEKAARMDELTDGFLELLRSVPGLPEMPESGRDFFHLAITFGYAGAIADLVRSEKSRKAALDRASAN